MQGKAANCHMLLRMIRETKVSSDWFGCVLTSQRCSLNRSPRRLSVSPIYKFLQSASANSWTYLTNKEKSDMFYHYTDILVKDHLADLVASILDKIFRTPLTKLLKMNIV